MTSRGALVTGAASGIGRAVAERLAREGYAVALLDRQGDLAREVADKLVAEGATAVAGEADVADPDQVRAAVAAARDQVGPITIAVTSAGVTGFCDLVDLQLEDWNRLLAVNLTGTFVTLQAVLPDMLAAGWGRVVTISSMSAQSGAPRMAHYVASKGGVIALTKALAVELAGRGITANTIPPSIVDTPMADEMQAQGDFPGVDVIAPLVPVGRVGTSEDIAAACRFLVSEEAGFITGQTVGVNGGWYLP